MANQFFDLTFERLPSGAIRLEQSSFDQESVIDLHPVQLRHVAEAFGLVPPNYPADELTKRLAEQLCIVMKELAGECHHSHWLEQTYIKLDAWCSAIPDDIFPFALWEDEHPEAASTSNPPRNLPVTAKTQVTHPRTNAEGGEQLGLAV